MKWVVLLVAAAASGAEMRVAAFRAEVTPAPGEPLIWTTPAARIEDPLWLKGIVLDDGASRYLVCAIDWCGVGGPVYARFRERLAAAVATDVSRVSLHSVHQHTAPYIDGDRHPMSEWFLEEVLHRSARAAARATERLLPFDRVGTAEARVEQVASARRILRDGKVLVRYSTSGKAPEMAALPEGAIDPLLRTITLAHGDRPLVRLHYYATHPQTFCCEGTVTADIPGRAREELEREENVFQIYFTGAGGDVTVGKYNDASAQAREKLAARLLAAMRASAAATRYAPAAGLRWRTSEFTLPAKPPAPATDYRSSLSAAFVHRKTPLAAALLEIGPAAILHLPGEPMLEFQNYARGLRPGRFTAVAGYGDISPGYLCTDQAHAEGGYEPSASHTGPGTEARVKKAIQELMR